jgi:hypothetical protein
VTLTDETAVTANDAPHDEAAGGAAAVHLTFVPDATPYFLLWGDGAGESSLAVCGHPARALLADENLKVQPVKGYALPLLDAVRALVAIPASEFVRHPASVGVWSLAAKLACELIARERIVPRVVATATGTRARSCVALNLADDHRRMLELAKAMPLAAHAVPATAIAPISDNSVPEEPQPATEVWSADTLLHAFLDAVADALVREARKRRGKSPSASAPWPKRFIAALAASDAQFSPHEFAERSLLNELQTWSESVSGFEANAPRLCIRLTLPEHSEDDARERFELHYYLRAAHDLNVLVDAGEIYRGENVLEQLHCPVSLAEERLLRDLSIASRLFAPIERSLREARPVGMPLTPESAWSFFSQAMPSLKQAGIAVLLPDAFARTGGHRLCARMHVGVPHKRDANLVGYRWEIELAGLPIEEEELRGLLEYTAPLVKHRGHWVALQRDEIEHALRLLKKRSGTLSAAAALAAVLGETIHHTDSELPITVVAEGDIAAKLERLRAAAGAGAVETPSDFRGALRPYQLRGVAWLEHLSKLGLGACLADDMGLGKTIQLIAYLLRRKAAQPDDVRPILLVCPTSVIGNWQRELKKFSPTLPVQTHDGSARARALDEIAGYEPMTIVLCSYAILRRDAELLTQVEWSMAVLDEAQNIKNAESITARTARTLRADVRIAMTGTPVENRLDELWSICEFLNPGLLGPLNTFRRHVALPIERFGREDVAESLKRIVRPLILRRVKSDTSIIQDLPSKQESKAFCLLTREQAQLYQGALDENLLAIEGADGIERRGHVLKLITELKQVCNHPAQYLKEEGPLAQRSGKLERLREMLDEVLASGERALVFTQYREMGSLLKRELAREFGREVFFLHGGTPRTARDAMVARFQGDRTASPIFILSVKAGGTGLNLTAATHVFHYDRWWNPAVEDQATDRAYRIGQQARVQVHKFLCAGTIEERVDALLESKRDLAARIVGQGEQWITELSNDQLRELFALSPNAVMDGAVIDGAALETERAAEQLELEAVT